MSGKVAIVLLNWNQPVDTANCLRSLRQLTCPDREIILVDNGSADGFPEKLEKEFPEVKMIRNRTNLGFAEGNNVGIRAALQSGLPYIMLLNNDTTVEPAFLEKLVAVAEADQKIGIISPQIMFYTERQKIWFAGGRYIPLLRKPMHSFYSQIEQGQVKRVTETDWASGCCLLIKREVLEKIGLLDKDYFLYNEDVDLCARAKAAGYKIVVVPDARIYHKFAASLGGKFSPLALYFRTRNLLLFLKKRSWYLALCLNLVIYPLYSIGEALKHRSLLGFQAVLTGVADFLAGKYGYGSGQRFIK
jgi:GT2 family glycosyltransferase